MSDSMSMDMNSMSMDMSSMSSSMSAMSSAMSSMSMASSTGMTMSMPTATSTTMDHMHHSGMAMSTSTASSMDMSGMSGMSHDMGSGSCNVHMLWNWQVKDSCFLSGGWHVETKGQFAGTCIGIFCWTVFVVLFGRFRKEFDNYLLRRKAAAVGSQDGVNSNSDVSTNSNEKAAATVKSKVANLCSMNPNDYRPNILEQIVRALLYGFEFSITWLLALIIMSYNGYVMISAFLGAFLGFLFINWQQLEFSTAPGKTTPHCC